MALALALSASVQIAADGMPRRSRKMTSATLAALQLPQSPIASITMSHSAAILSSISSAAGKVAGTL